uniref:Uncharacterized protein n=1 Tax=Mastacembelus armatus TaxID=205130 RepID=A0A7N8XRR6_9TELE
SDSIISLDVFQRVDIFQHLVREDKTSTHQTVSVKFPSHSMIQSVCMSVYMCMCVCPGHSLDRLHSNSSAAGARLLMLLCTHLNVTVK